jgi:probable phosphoglycerate mutase
VPSYAQTRYTPPPGALQLLLVRHGASAPFTGESFPLKDGHGDPPLDPIGEAQASAVAPRLADMDLDAIYVTSLQRTAQTAAPLMALRPAIPVAVEPDLREVFLGEWEGGLLRQRFAEGDPIATQVMLEERWDAIPGAEPASAFEARIKAAVDRIFAGHAGDRVAVFTHGGVISEILHIASGSRPFAFAASENTSISEIVVTDERWSVRRFNDTAHLD